MTQDIYLPVHVAQIVDWTDRQHHLSNVEASHVLRKTVIKFAQEGKEIASAIVIHHQVLKHKLVFYKLLAEIIK